MNNSKNFNEKAINKNYFIENFLSVLKDKSLKLILKNENIEDNYLLLNLITENIPFFIFLKDKELKYITCNKLMLKHLGAESKKDITGKSDLDLFQDKYTKTINNYEKQLIKNIEPSFEKKEKYLNTENLEQTYICSRIPLLDEEKKIIGLIGIGRDITEKNSNSENLFISDYIKSLSYKTVIKNIINTSTDNIYLKDTKGKFILLNKSQAEWLGLESTEEALGKTDFDFFSTEHANKAKKDEIEILKTKKSISIEEKNIWLNGKEAWVSTKKHPLYDDNNEIVGTFGVTRDITARKKAENSLFIEKERINTTLMSIGDAVVSTDKEGNIVSMNPMAEKMTGWTEKESRGKKLHKVFKIIHENDNKEAENPIDSVLKKNKTISSAGDIILINKNKKKIPIKDTFSPIHNNSGEIMGAVLVFHDDTQAREHTQRISYRATHDSLTNTFNRTEFERQLLELTKSAKIYDEKHAMLYLDLDKFKPVNDKCGHVAGDLLLKNLSNLIQLLLRDTDILARLGGDEFGILLKNCSIKHAQIIANKIIHGIKNYQFVWGLKTFNIGVSIGLVPITRRSESKETILSDADNAMYLAKEKGGDIAQINYGDEENINKIEWEARINNAYKNNLFDLCIMPIKQTINKKNKAEIFEIIVYLRDDDNEIIPPNIFAAPAERYSLTPKIELWAIKNLFEKISEHITDYKSSIYLIPISNTSLNSDELLESISELFSKNDISDFKICFEFDEVSVMTNIGKVLDFIKETKKFGCFFSIGGIKLSSLSYLKFLSVDFLTIDKTIIKTINKDIVDYTSVKAIQEIARAKGIKTIANYVNSTQIKTKLKQIGIDFIKAFDENDTKLFS